MAYEVLPGAALELRLEGLHEGQQVMTVLHYRYKGITTLPDGGLALTAFLTAVGVPAGLVESWRAALSAKITGLKAVGQFIQPSRFAYKTLAIDPPTGGVAGDAYPVNTSGAITKRGEQANRHNIGTVHMPAVPMTFILNGTLLPAATLAYGIVGDRILEEVATLAPAAVYEPVIFNRVAFATSPKPVAFAVKPFARIMRRRTVGVGS